MNFLNSHVLGSVYNNKLTSSEEENEVKEEFKFRASTACQSCRVGVRCIMQ